MVTSFRLTLLGEQASCSHAERLASHASASTSCSRHRPELSLRRAARQARRCHAGLQELLEAVPAQLPPQSQELLPPGPSWQQLAAETPNLLAGSEPLAAPLRVALLLSGGVDSSLALRLLQQAGHHVEAFYLQIWFQDDFRNFWSACPWEDDLAVCRQVCEQAGVQLHVVPLTEQYWDRVVASALADIRAGRTPNPDMLCNSRIKFGAFHEHMQQQQGPGFDRIASGHYALIDRSAGEEGRVQLRSTPDAIKDQTYFLAGLSQEQLGRCTFPLGCLTKAQVRALAAAAQLPNRGRPDSQGICFLGHVRFPEFVQQHLGTMRGPLIEEETGALVGVHQGVWFYTPGQRKGILLPGGPWYVCRKDLRRNAVFISRHYHEPERLRRSFWCSQLSWCSGQRPELQDILQCKTRHGPRLYGAHIMQQAQAAGRECLQVQLDADDQGLAEGQFAVFYRQGVCLGSAVICSAPGSQQAHEVQAGQEAGLQPRRQH